jgi:hypothetical protein
MHLKKLGTLPAVRTDRKGRLRTNQGGSEEAKVVNGDVGSRS